MDLKEKEAGITEEAGKRRLEAREKIDEADRRIADAFVLRMEASREIGACKEILGLPVLDRTREAAVLSDRIRLVPEELRPYYQELLLELMTLSKRWQEALSAPCPDEGSEE